MIRTVILECTLPAAKAHALNAESGHVYSRTMAAHFGGAHRANERSEEGKESLPRAAEPLLHRTSRSIARQGFYTALRAAEKNHRRGIARGMPVRAKTYRTTVWRGPAIRLLDGKLRLARAWKMSDITIVLPPDLAQLSQTDFREVRLVWSAREAHHYWQVVIDERRQEVFGARVAAVDLGSAYPATVTDGDVAIVFEIAELKTLQQRTDRQVERIRQKMGSQTLRSREYRRLLRKARRVRDLQGMKAHPLERLVSEAVLDWAVQNGVGTLVVGDADGLARDGKLPAEKLSRGGGSIQNRIMRYLAAMARKIGIIVRFVDEAFTSQICPGCGHRNRASGRCYRCKVCGFEGHRDAVGSSNLLSRYLYGALGQVWPQQTRVYRPAEPKRRSARSGGSLAGATA